MKRFLPALLIASAALASTFLMRPAALVGQAPVFRTSAAPCCYEECCGEKDCCLAAKNGKTDAVVVAELVAILDDTKSADTYLATLLALSQFEDKSPLPAVVRNAARLGLLKGLSKKANPTQAQQIIGAYLSGEMSVEAKLAAKQCNSPSAYYAYPPPMPAPTPMAYAAPLRAPAVSPSCASSTPIQQFVPVTCPERLGPPRCVPENQPVSTPESESPSAQPTKKDVESGRWSFFSR